MAGILPSAELTVSAGTPDQFPRATGPEFCVVGRSNVGKSSFINHVLADRRLARVSSRPGKTTLANFYRLSTGDTWIDLPGYGYAHTSKADMDRLSTLVRACCTDRPQLQGVLWLVDIRHPGLGADREAGEWLEGIGVPVMIVLTKSDKVSNSQALRLEGEHKRVHCRGWQHLRFSVRATHSRQTFWNAYGQWRGDVARGRGAWKTV